jgi:hypothetical protein
MTKETMEINFLFSTRSDANGIIPIPATDLANATNVIISLASLQALFGRNFY